MSKSERVLLVVPVVDLVLLLGEELESVQVLILGTEAESLVVDVSLELLVKLKLVLLALMETEAEHSGSLGKLQHLGKFFCLIIINLITHAPFQNVIIR